ncbi:RNA polymerase sigma factor [Chitinophaga qingshengii]|uniref:Sigma-70 family RNA polymerase sigma factor n=1 Tax=Chitinophaga qingshengii TaxID=1569794 RepID=A0ABR7TFU0_9BACT|nr:sigma-70 family RNA polymerase sigma factor [Chitinophaga qingshengii]MBC9929237.1 sigma-70 family RNA polymerase sigma factor [Chitinophaga qingshengii]
MGLKCIDNEQQILEQIAGGNEEAFSKLFHGYLNQAARIVFSLVGSKEQTEEIMQDLFVKLWKNRLQLIHIKEFNAYFFILLRNHTLNHLMKMVAERKRQQAYVKFVTSEEQPESPQPDGRLDILDKAIDALPVQQKTVFLLRSQGYRNPEIALRMNLSTDSVKKYNQLAIKSIHRFMKVHVSVSLAILATRFLN